MYCYGHSSGFVKTRTVLKVRLGKHGCGQLTNHPKVHTAVLHEMIVANTVKFAVFCVAGRSVEEPVTGPSNPSCNSPILFL
jgi:hypothetical protein